MNNNEVFDHNNSLGRKINDFVFTTPAAFIEDILSKLDAIEDEGQHDPKSSLLRSIANGYVRKQFASLLKEWEILNPGNSLKSLKLAIQVSLDIKNKSEKATVDLVWTGPETSQVPTRRTDQALLQVIGSAKSELLVVSFAVYKIPLLVKAIEESLERGVQISICFEEKKESDSALSFSGIGSLSQKIRENAKFYIWPKSKRMTSASGDIGVLHSKVALADKNLLLLTSANLTDHALDINMELGVLFTEGDMPLKVYNHFHEMIDRHILVRRR